MALQRWKWWQWFLASLVVGALLGYVFSNQEVDDPSIPSISVPQFMRKLQLRTDAGGSVVTDIRISPAVPDVHGKMMRAVSFWELQKRKDNGQWQRAREWRMYTPTPLYVRAPRKDYGIVEFLTDRKKEIPTLDFAVRWWEVPRYMYLLCIGGSILVIGVLWPIVLRGLVKAGFGSPEVEEAVDLSKVRTTRGDIPTRTGKGVTTEDRDQLETLNAELASNVAGMAIGGAPPNEAENKKAEQAIRELPNVPQERVAVEAPPKPSDEDYKGEYYPVARPTGKK